MYINHRIRLVCLITFFVLIAVISVSGQKPSLDTSAFRTWTYAMNPALSPNGQFASYEIRNQSHRNNILVIKSLVSAWEIEIVGASQCIFPENDLAIYQINDTVALFHLNDQSKEIIAGVSSFSTFQNGSDQWLILQYSIGRENLQIKNLRTNETHKFRDVSTFKLSPKGDEMIIEFTDTLSASKGQRLTWVSIPEFSQAEVWTSQAGDTRTIEGVTLDNINDQLAFILSDQNHKQIYYYKKGSKAARLLLSNSSAGITPGFAIDNIANVGFSGDGNRLFFTQVKKFSTGIKAGVPVDIWNYKDVKLQSEQLFDIKSNPVRIESRTCVLNLSNNNILPLNGPGEEISFFDGNNHHKEALIYANQGSEYYWNPASRFSIYLISCLDGHRTPFLLNNTKISPDGRYILGMDSTQRNCLVYDLTSGQSRNLSASIPIPQIDMEFDEKPGPKPGEIVVYNTHWIDGGKKILLCDKYDIWIVDPTGKSAPVNVTSGYGRKNKIVFRVSSIYERSADFRGDTLLVNGFDRLRKWNGFYSITLRTPSEPKRLTMGPYLYDWETVQYHAPVKARDVNVFLIRRMSASQSPNFFVTTDFINLKPLSNVYPESRYNWLTSEVNNFISLDGKTRLQGVLYKPENFDLHKKYPVIITYYEKKSDHANEFDTPYPMSDNISISWFVSNGYLVFTPDIQYTIGQSAKSAFNAIVGAYNHLGKFSWVDAKKVAIAGHSWGSYQTNYIVAHTNVFAAALSASGMADWASDYGSLSNTGQVHQYFYENDGQGRLGYTPWQRPDLYVESSPVFRIDKINTPLLLMNNKEDGIVPFYEGVEFFTGLRRAQKRAWMLQYDGETHSLLDEKSRIDYTLRVTQFFDYYLKGKLPPKWMTVGIPAYEKSINTGLDLDQGNIIP